MWRVVSGLLSRKVINQVVSEIYSWTALLISAKFSKKEFCLAILIGQILAMNGF